jgi:hypothetical protein
MFNKTGQYICKDCGKIFEKLQAYNGHRSQLHSKLAGKFRHKWGWNKGKTKETDHRIAKICKTLSENYKSGKIIPDKSYCKTEDYRRKMALSMTKWPRGGVKSVKFYDYKCLNGDVIKLRGTYEVRFAKFLDENNYQWEYTKKLEYKDQSGKSRIALPDFYLPKFNCYFETKGYFPEKQKEKFELIKLQSSIEIILIFEKDLLDLEKGTKTLLSYIPSRIPSL